MNLDHAPKFFWFALSVSLLLLTGVILIIAYRASSVSIEFADAKIGFANDKIEVSRIVSETKEQLETLQRQNQELQIAKTNLEAELARLNTVHAGTNSPFALKPEIAEVSRALSNVSRTLPPEHKVQADLNSLRTIQSTLTRSSKQ